MTTRDVLLDQLFAIASPDRREHVEAMFEKFPARPDKSRAELTDEADLRGRISKKAQELADLLDRHGDPEWLDAFYGVSPGWLRRLKKIPGYFKQSGGWAGKEAGDIPSKRGTGSTIRQIYLHRIADWCVQAAQILTGEEPTYGDRLKDLYRAATTDAGEPLAQATSEGDDFWHLRESLREYRDRALTTDRPDAA